MSLADDEKSQTSKRMKQSNLAQYARRYDWILTVVWLFIVVFCSHYLPLVIRSVNLNVYVIQPLLWISLAALVLILLQVRPRELWAATDRWVLGIGCIAGLFQVSILVLSGLLVGFGYSPYSHSPGLILLNAWFVISRLVGMELARWHLLVHFKQRSQLLGVSLAWLTLTLANLPITRLSAADLDNIDSLFRLVGNAILPIASTNFLATYLMLAGGPFTSLAYLGVLAAFEWLSPILPNMEWLLNAFLGTVVPILAVLFVHDFLEWRAGRTGEPAHKSGSVGTPWVLISVLVVFFLWFNNGLFGVRPTLISGISMEPAINPGDIVITREVTPSEVKTGDVVLFSDENHSILHRVVSIQTGGGSSTFLTKGDNVEKMDDPWQAHQLKGKLVLVIPKLGWVSFWIKDLFSRIL
jgi:signal peptidase